MGGGACLEVSQLLASKNSAGCYEAKFATFLNDSEVRTFYERSFAAVEGIHLVFRSRTLDVSVFRAASL